MSRSRRERKDSVDASVLAERAAWAERLEASPPETAEEAARERTTRSGSRRPASA